MSKIHILLKILRTLLKEPKSITRVLQNVDEKKKVQEQYGFIDGLPTIDLLDLFPDFQISVEPYSFLDGTSTILDIALLNALAKKHIGCQYLEIGTWKGESVANVSRFADKCVSISLSEAEMRTFRLSEEFIKVHRFFSEKLKNVEHIGHNSHNFDYSLLNTKFDLIFVDGDHSYQGVKIDTENVFKMLRDDNSIIVWHDYGVNPERVRWDTLAGILDGCPLKNRKYLYHVSNTMCAIFIKSDFDTTFTRFPSTPNKKFEIAITAKRI